MATWQQVKNYVYSNYRVNSDEGGHITLLFEVPGGRSQFVSLLHVEAGNLSGVSFLSPIANWGDISPERLLLATEQIPIGVRKVGDFLMAYHNQLLISIDEPEIDLTLTMVTNFADDLEKSLGLGDKF